MTRAYVLVIHRTVFGCVALLPFMCNPSYLPLSLGPKIAAWLRGLRYLDDGAYFLLVVSLLISLSPSVPLLLPASSSGVYILPSIPTTLFALFVWPVWAVHAVHRCTWRSGAAASSKQHQRRSD